MKNAIGILIGIALIHKLLWEVWSFKNIDSSNPWACFIFPFVCAVFNFYHQYLIVFWVQVFITSLVRFLSGHSILFDAIVNGVAFLISLSDSSLWMYRYATDLWKWILQLTISLNLFISFSSFLGASLGFSIYSIISYTKSESFTSFQFGFFLLSNCCG